MLLFGINYAKGEGGPRERQLGPTSSLEGRGQVEGGVTGLGLEAIPTGPGQDPHGRAQGAFQDKAKVLHLRR